MLQKKKKFSVFHPQKNFTIFIQIEPSINVSLPIKMITDTWTRKHLILESDIGVGNKTNTH